MSVWNPTFDIEEYRNRLKKIQGIMSQKGLDCLLLNNRADVNYVTGMETCYMVAYHACIVPVRGDPVVIASDFEMLNALTGTWCSDRMTFPAVFGSAVSATCKILQERGFSKGRIGIQTSAISEEFYSEMKTRLGNPVLVPSEEIMHEAKIVKSHAEIEYIRKAGMLTTKGMESAMKECRAGVTDNDVASSAFETLVRGGSEFMCIDPIVTVGERSGIPHSTFRRTRINPGDSIFIEIGACLCRYSAPMMRTVAISPVPDVIKTAADSCSDALDALIENMKPGAIAKEVAEKAESAWTPICKELIWHGCYAYSIGLGFPPDWNDCPGVVTVESELVLKPGMCFHATTSLRKAGKYGTAMGETVLITEKGNEVLTETERKLLVI